MSKNLPASVRQRLTNKAKEPCVVNGVAYDFAEAQDVAVDPEGLPAELFPRFRCVD